jgi:hypothetical protein
MNEQELRATMLQAILAQGIPAQQAITDAEAAVAYVLKGRPTQQAIPIIKKRDAMLDMWAAHVPTREIAAALGLKRTSVVAMVAQARRSGDPRAVRRKAAPASLEHLRASAAKANAIRIAAAASRA